VSRKTLLSYWEDAVKTTQEVHNRVWSPSEREWCRGWFLIGVFAVVCEFDKYEHSPEEFKLLIREWEKQVELLCPKGINGH
jgi:hypothetical protein